MDITSRDVLPLLDGGEKLGGTVKKYDLGSEESSTSSRKWWGMAVVKKKVDDERRVKMGYGPRRETLPRPCRP